MSLAAVALASSDASRQSCGDHPPGDITRIMVLVIIIGLLLAGSFWTLLPFLGSAAWGTMIVVAVVILDNVLRPILIRRIKM